MNRVFAIFLILTCSLNLSAQQLSVSTGSFAVHTFYYMEDYKIDCITNDEMDIQRNKPFSRAVIRPQIGISYREPIGVKYYYQLGVFAGKDCLYGQIFGAIGEFGRSRKYLNAGVIMGGYFRDQKLWQDHYFKGGSFIPIVGINLTMKKEFNRIGIELSNKITPLMTIHNLSLTYKL